MTKADTLKEATKEANNEALIAIRDLFIATRKMLKAPVEKRAALLVVCDEKLIAVQQSRAKLLTVITEMRTATTEKQIADRKP